MYNFSLIQMLTGVFSFWLQEVTEDRIEVCWENDTFRKWNFVHGKGFKNFKQLVLNPEVLPPASIPLIDYGTNNSRAIQESCPGSQSLHKFKSTQLGNCLTLQICIHCSAKHIIDSSD